MISCINPSYISSNHTINTLRYSDRLKEQTAFVQKQIGNNKIKANNYNSNYNTHQQKSNNNNNNLNIPKTQPSKKEIDREKELEEINMNVFNAKDDILNDINFDERINLDDDLLEFQKIENNEINKKEKENIITPQKNMDNNSEKIIDEEMEDLIYLKKTVSKDGKFISDDFIKYHKLTDTIIQDEDDIINTHMEVVKQDAKLLTEEGRLISLIKGIGTDEDKIEIDEYIQRLDNVLDQKMNIYSGLQDKIDIYKGHLKEEDKMRKEYPQFFVDPADL
jgi:kinesin family protein 2/24